MTGTAIMATVPPRQCLVSPGAGAGAGPGTSRWRGRGATVRGAGRGPATPASQAPCTAARCRGRPARRRPRWAPVTSTRHASYVCKYSTIDNVVQYLEKMPTCAYLHNFLRHSASAPSIIQHCPTSFAFLAPSHQQPPSRLVWCCRWRAGRGRGPATPATCPPAPRPGTTTCRGRGRGTCRTATPWRPTASPAPCPRDQGGRRGDPARLLCPPLSTLG